VIRQRNQDGGSMVFWAAIHLAALNGFLSGRPSRSAQWFFERSSMHRAQWFVERVPRVTQWCVARHGVRLDNCAYII
jgi:hypothetical protein